MELNERLVQDIVKSVVAKMNLQQTSAGSHGVFQDMNDAIEHAKAAQRLVQKMSMDQREKI
ncbi:MAG: aldehyde dehydrogenase EutE, partial [Catenibacillus sp.]